MSLADFSALTIPEFVEVYTAWQNCRRADSYERWQLMRMQTAAMLAPWSKKSIDPKKLFPHPLDKEERRQSEEQKVLSREESHERYKALMEKLRNNG